MSRLENESIREQIRAITALQRGGVTRSQLHELALGPAVVDGWIKSHRLRRLHRGVRVSMGMTPRTRISVHFCWIRACSRREGRGWKRAGPLPPFLRPNSLSFSFQSASKESANGRCSGSTRRNRLRANSAS
jgi:hypothetical protein